MEYKYPEYDDPNMQQYFDSLPDRVKANIILSSADICSPGELTMIGEHFKNEFGYHQEK